MKTIEKERIEQLKLLIERFNRLNEEARRRTYAKLSDDELVESLAKCIIEIFKTLSLVDNRINIDDEINKILNKQVN